MLARKQASSFAIILIAFAIVLVALLTTSNRFSVKPVRNRFDSVDRNNLHLRRLFDEQ